MIIGLVLSLLLFRTAAEPGPPAGRLVYLTAEDRLAIWSDGKVRTLTTARENAAFPVWSPGGDRVAYVELTGAGSKSPFRVTVLPLERSAGGSRQLAPASDGLLLWREVEGLYWPRPDRIAVEGRIDPDTVQVALLDVPSGRLLETRPGKSFSWSPDGAKLAAIGWIPHFAPAEIQEQERVEIESEVVYPAETAVRARIRPPLVWSWDSGRLAFLARRDGRVRLVVVGEGRPRELTAELGVAPRLLAWSDDGDSLLVETKGGYLRVDGASGQALRLSAEGLADGFRRFVEDGLRGKAARDLDAERGSWWPPAAAGSNPSRETKTP